MPTLGCNPLRRQARGQEGVSGLSTRKWVLRLVTRDPLPVHPPVCLGGDVVPAGSLLASPSAWQQRTRSPLAQRQSSRVSWDPGWVPHPTLSDKFPRAVAGVGPPRCRCCIHAFHGWCPFPVLAHLLPSPLSNPSGIFANKLNMGGGDGSLGGSECEGMDVQSRENQAASPKGWRNLLPLRSLPHIPASQTPSLYPYLPWSCFLDNDSFCCCLRAIWLRLTLKGQGFGQLAADQLCYQTATAHQDELHLQSPGSRLSVHP